MSRFIFNADDFGWTEAHNRAVEVAHAEGVLDRASLMANGPAFDDAVAVARRSPGLAVGVHLTLLEGAPVSPRAAVPDLVDGGGRFPDGLAPLVATWQLRRRIVAQIEREWRAQIARVLEAGLRPTHLDSHKHVHLLPPLFDLTIRLAKEAGVPYVRLPLPPARDLRARPSAAVFYPLALAQRGRLRRSGIAFADRLVGFANSGRMTADRLVAELDRHQHDGGVTEVMLHPARDGDALDALRRRYRWARAYRFEDELAALCDPRVRRFRG